MNLNITKDFLEKLETPKRTIDFLESNKILPTTSDVITEIISDYDLIISDLRDTLNNGVALDDNGNPVVFKIRDTEYTKTYDLENRNIYMSTSDGVLIEKEYNKYGNVIKLRKVTSDDDPMLEIIDYNDDGLVTQDILNGSITEYVYDESNRPIRIINKHGTTIILYSGNESIKFINGDAVYEKTDANGNVIYHQSKYAEWESKYDQNNIQVFFRNIKLNHSSTTKVYVDMFSNKSICKSNSDGYTQYRHEDFNGNTMVLYAEGRLIANNAIDYYSNGQLKKINDMEIPFIKRGE